MQDQPDQATLSMGNRPDGLIMSQARDGAAVHNFEDASFGSGCGVGRLVENAPHVAVTLRGAVAVVHARALLVAGAWPITANEHYKEALTQAADGECPNNISIVLKYHTGGGKVLWMGDLESDFMDKIKDEVAMEATDILFAPHHGRDSGKVPAEWLEQMEPQVIIIGEAPSEHLNYYSGYNTITQNSAGDITMECVEGKTHFYVSNYDYSVDFLDDENKTDDCGKYIGTLTAGA
jgi:hypothetical protein